MGKTKENLYYPRILKKALSGVKHVYNSFFYRYKTHLIVFAIVFALAITVTVILDDFTKRNDYTVDRATVFLVSKYSEENTSAYIRLIHGSKIPREEFLQQVDVRTLKFSQLQGFLAAYPFNGVIDESQKVLLFFVDAEGRLGKRYSGASGMKELRQDLIDDGYLEVKDDE